MTCTEGQQSEKKSRHLCLEREKGQKDEMNNRRKRRVEAPGREEEREGEGGKEQGHESKEKEEQDKKEGKKRSPRN